MFYLQESPEYKKVDMSIDFLFNSFFFICNPPTVTALLEFALKLYVSFSVVFRIYLILKYYALFFKTRMIDCTLLLP
jgi:hypothetical protein